MLLRISLSNKDLPLKQDIQVQLQEVLLWVQELRNSEPGKPRSEKTLPMEQQVEKKLFFNLSSMMELPAEDTELISLNQNSKFLDHGVQDMLLILLKLSLTMQEE
jgi:hypothetical protein